MTRLLGIIGAILALAGCATPGSAEPRHTSASIPEFYVSDVSANEDDGSASVTITKRGRFGSKSSAISYSVVPGEAKAAVDFKPTLGTLNFGPGTTTKTVALDLINDDIAENTETFSFQISARTNARIADATGLVTILDTDETPCDADKSTPQLEDDCSPASTPEATQTCEDGSVRPASEECPPVAPPQPETQTCWDGSIITATDDCPPPPDAAPPPSESESGWVPAPSPAGIAAVATTDFDVSTALKPAWGSGAIPPLNSNDVVGAFRFICGAGQLRYDDPIVYPGQPGRSHLHQFYGHLGADANSTYSSLRATGDSTCSSTGTADGNGKAANRSAYWEPAMLDGKGHVVLPDYIQVYYKREPLNSSQCDPNSPTKVGICIGIPNGIRFIQGFKMATGTQGGQIGQFRCGSNVWKANADALSKATNATCPPGTKLEMTMHSGRCWDGNLDSPDHMSHLQPMVRNASTNWLNRCPLTHPYYLPQFTISSFYTIGPDDDVSLWSLSSDAMYPNLKRGSTVHFDYFEGWDEVVKKAWTSACVDRKLNCSGGDLGNGLQLKGAAKPSYGWSNPNRLVAIPANSHGM